MAAYVPQEWRDGDESTPLSAARLTHIEQGISAHDHDADAITTGVFSPARIPSLSISKTTGLRGELDALIARLEALEGPEA